MELQYLNLGNNELEKRFLCRVLLIVLIRLLKYAWDFRNKFTLVFTSQATVTELIYTSNDFIFIYALESLIEHLKLINNDAKNARSGNDLKFLKQEICHVFSMKRKLMKRYGLDIFITVTYNFILLVIALYWTLMRVYFNLLIKFEHYWTFTNILGPCYMLWIIFSKCEEFTSTVRFNIVNLTAGFEYVIKYAQTVKIRYLTNQLISLQM